MDFTEYPNKKITDLIPEEAAFYPIRKKDQLPAYHLTSVVDDLHFGVDLVVRGKDLYPSTLAQLDLAGLLDASKFAESTFYHHQLLKGPHQNKLSKSAGDTSIQFLRKAGKKLPEIVELLGAMIGRKGEILSFHDLSQTLP
jgi:glutamyl-tRNA synthetase